MSYITKFDFIATAIAEITTGDNANMTDDFTAIEVPVDSDMATLAFTFTHAGAGDGANVDFYFQASYDGGTTFTTKEFILVQIPSDIDYDASGIRRYAQVDWYQGISHLRLWKVVNNDAASITDVNASLSRGYARPDVNFRH